MTTRHRVWKRHRTDEYLHRDGKTYTRDPEQARKYPADRTHPPQGEDHTDGCWVRA